MKDKDHIDTPASLSVNGRLKFLFRDSALYGGAAAFSKFFALFTFPVLTRVYSVGDYGLIDAFTILAQLLTVLIVFGQDTAVARHFYEYEDTGTRRQIVSQSLVIQLGFAVVAVPLLWFYADQIALLYTKEEGSAKLCKLAIAQVPFALLISFSMNLLKWTFSRGRFIFISIGSALFSVVAILVGVLVFRVDIAGLFWLYLLSRMIFAAIGMCFCRKWLVVPRSLCHARELLCFGVPYGVICVLTAFMPALDRGFISNMLSAEVLGLYAVGYKMAALLRLPIKAFQTAWGPFAYAIFKEEDANHTYDQVLSFFTIFIGLCVVAISVCAEPLLVLLASEKHVASVSLIGPLALGIAVEGICWILGIGIDLAKKSYLNVSVYTLHLIVTAIGIYVLIMPYGVLGVAFAILIGKSFKVVFQTWIAYKAHPLRFSLKRPLLIALGMIGAVIFGPKLTSSGYPQDVFVCVPFMCLYAGLMWRFALSRSERNVLSSWLARRVSG